MSTKTTMIKILLRNFHGMVVLKKDLRKCVEHLEQKFGQSDLSNLF